MTTPYVRCPVCREVIEASEAAWDRHMVSHSTSAMLRAACRRDRPAAVFAVGVAVLVAVVWVALWWALFVVDLGMLR